MTTSTIAAIATSHGQSSISVIRISGPQAYTIALTISQKEKLDPRVAHLSSLYDTTGELIDQAIMIYFAAPKSFTGEDIVEFQCHGGMIVAEAILAATLAHGAVLAEPGEFTKRAFLNGKIDLTKAEATARIIEAKSLDAAKILARQLKGELKDFVDESREMLLRLIAYSEVMIDYAEEDLPEDILHSMLSQIDDLEKKLENILLSSRRRRGLIDGFRVSIVGKPNVGKSSLLNALLSYERAIVSDIAGTTRDTIEEQIRIGTHVIRFVDTAGIREANDTIEQIGIERSLKSIDESDIIIALFDGSNNFDDQDGQILSILEQHREKHIIVAINKDDLEQKLDTLKFEGYDPIRISSKRGFVNLTDRLGQTLESIGGSDDLMLISARQIDAVERAATALHEAVQPLRRGELEFFSYHINDTLGAISSISKPYESEEILDKMFGEFCLGK